MLVNKVQVSTDEIRTVVQELYETVGSRLNELSFINRFDTIPALNLKHLGILRALLSLLFGTPAKAAIDLPDVGPTPTEKTERINV